MGRKNHWPHVVAGSGDRQALPGRAGRQNLALWQICYRHLLNTWYLEGPGIKAQPAGGGAKNGISQFTRILAEKGLEMGPVGAPHGVALRHFLRNEVPAAGLVPMMPKKGLEMRPLVTLW